MSPYTPRILDAELDELLAGLPAVAIDGPKAVGKTATATQRATTRYLLDNEPQRQILAADLARALGAPPPVLFDEWQRLPQIWDALRRAVDDGAPAGRYLLTGSAAPDPSNEAIRIHSGAGRIVSLRMRPLALAERGLGRATVSLTRLLTGDRPKIEGTTTVRLEDYAHEIVASGFPGIRGLPPRLRRSQLDGYLTHIVDRDFIEAGHSVRKPDVLMRWMRSYAAATGTVTSLEKIRDGATSGEGDTATRPTVQMYRDILERLWLLDSLPGWLPARNQLGRLQQAPRHHLADTALAARLLGLDTGALLAGDVSPLFQKTGPLGVRALGTRPRDGTLFGQLFESLVTLSVKVYAQAAQATVRHFRTFEGRKEVDLIVVRDDHRVVALEVKLSETVGNADVEHLLWLRRQLGPDLLDAAVITTGKEAYRRQEDGIAVVPAALLTV